MTSPAAIPSLLVRLFFCGCMRAWMHARARSESEFVCTYKRVCVCVCACVHSHTFLLPSLQARLAGACVYAQQRQGAWLGSPPNLNTLFQGCMTAKQLLNFSFPYLSPHRSSLTGIFPATDGCTLLIPLNRSAPTPLPTGSDLMTNMWWIHRDPAYWPQPSRFDPQRYGARG
jgi:hypothetical protein